MLVCMEIWYVNEGKCLDYRFLLGQSPFKFILSGSILSIVFLYFFLSLTFSFITDSIKQLLSITTSNVMISCIPNIRLGDNITLAGTFECETDILREEQHQ